MTTSKKKNSRLQVGPAEDTLEVEYREIGRRPYNDDAATRAFFMSSVKKHQSDDIKIHFLVSK